MYNNHHQKHKSVNNLELCYNYPCINLCQNPQDNELEFLRLNLSISFYNDSRDPFSKDCFFYYSKKFCSNGIRILISESNYIQYDGTLLVKDFGDGGDVLVSSRDYCLMYFDNETEIVMCIRIDEDTGTGIMESKSAGKLPSPT